MNNTETRSARHIPALGYYPLQSRSQNVGLSYLHIFTPQLTAEVAGNYYRTFFYFLNASNFNGKDVVSQAGITGFEGISNLQPAAPLHQSLRLRGARRAARITGPRRTASGRINTGRSVSWSHGNHDMKFGAQLSHQAHAFLNGNASQGTFNFDGRYTQNPLSAGNTGDAFADFLLGYPFSVQRATPIQIFGDSGNFFHMFAPGQLSDHPQPHAQSGRALGGEFDAGGHPRTDRMRSISPPARSSSRPETARPI